MKRGFTLVECLISLLLVIIVLVGGAGFYFYASQILRGSTHRRIAAEIADSKTEEIKNAGYSSLPNPAPGGLWQGPINVTIGGLTGQENIYVYDIDDDEDTITDYKQVKVKVNWPEPGKSTGQEISLDTYLAP